MDNSFSFNLNVLRHPETVRRIVVRGSDPNDVGEEVYSNPSGSLDIIVVQPGMLSNQDFLFAIKASGPIVSCTGDISMAEVIGAGKLPFYIRPGHKLVFMNSLIDLVRYYLGDADLLSYLNLFNTDLNSAAIGTQSRRFMDRLDQLLQNGQFDWETLILGWIRISSRIRTEFNPENFIVSTIKGLFFQTRDWIEELQDAIGAFIQLYDTDPTGATQALLDFLETKKSRRRAKDSTPSTPPPPVFFLPGAILGAIDGQCRGCNPDNDDAF